MTGVYVAAGSNIDARRNMQRAVAEMRAAFPGLKVSRAYQNEAVGFQGEDFINLVVGFETDKSLDQVIADMRQIETLCGRPRDAAKWAPRSMDLDILLYGDVVGEFAHATLPRPDLLKRPYMLGPLADIAPQVRHPTAGRSIAELWGEFDQKAHAMREVSID